MQNNSISCVIEAYPLRLLPGRPWSLTLTCHLGPRAAYQMAPWGGSFKDTSHLTEVRPITTATRESLSCSVPLTYTDTHMHTHLWSWHKHTWTPDTIESELHSLFISSLAVFFPSLFLNLFFKLTALRVSGRRTTANSVFCLLCFAMCSILK